MYQLSIPVAEIRTKIRQEFERHRYVKQLSVVDVLLFQSHAEYQVGFGFLYETAYIGNGVTCVSCPYEHTVSAMRKDILPIQSVGLDVKCKNLC